MTKIYCKNLNEVITIKYTLMKKSVYPVFYNIQGPKIHNRTTHNFKDSLHSTNETSEIYQRKPIIFLPYLYQLSMNQY